MYRSYIFTETAEVIWALCIIRDFIYSYSSYRRLFVGWKRLKKCAVLPAFGCSSFYFRVLLFSQIVWVSLSLSCLYETTRDDVDCGQFLRGFNAK